MTRQEVFNRCKQQYDQNRNIRGMTGMLSYATQTSKNGMVLLWKSAGISWDFQEMEKLIF